MKKIDLTDMLTTIEKNSLMRNEYLSCLEKKDKSKKNKGRLKIKIYG